MQISHREVKKYVSGKSVIVLGSAPCVANVTADQLREFNIIVRLNNYKHFCKCHKTDIYYSFFGSSIIKSEQQLKKDGCKFIIHKYPYIDFTKHHKHQDGIALDCRDSKYERDWNIPQYRVPKTNFITNYMMADRMMTTGVSAIVEMIRLGGNVTIAGFDFFESGIHNLDEKWVSGDGNHNVNKEKEIVDMLEKYEIIKAIK